MKSIFFVTGNKNKVWEARQILGYPLEMYDVDLDEIQSLDINEVVKKKAQDAYEIVKSPLIVEDVGMYVSAWNGFPGPLVKLLHQAGGGNYDMVVRMLEGEDDKSVEVKAVIGLHDGKKVHMIEGSFRGQIVQGKGKNGWGFDPYIIPEGYAKTFGELPEEVKNTISHRARAFQNLKVFLESHSV